MTPIDWNQPGWLRIVRESLSRYEQETLVRRQKIEGSGDVYDLLRERAEREEVEVFYSIMLDRQHRVIALQEVSRGIVHSALVQPREIFRLAILVNAVAIIVSHNHPSGSAEPSADDRTVTRQIVEAGRILDLPCVDHVIIGADEYYSFAESDPGYGLASTYERESDSGDSNQEGTEEVGQEADQEERSEGDQGDESRPEGEAFLE
jgi:DNA repair protein RadC